MARGEGGDMPGGDADAKNEVGKQIRRGKRRSRKSRQAKQVQSPSMTLKDYFPVRRSNRRCKAAIEVRFPPLETQTNMIDFIDR